MLFHVNEERDITRFEPRVPAGGGPAVVWAIDAGHLRNWSSLLSACATRCPERTLTSPSTRRKARYE